MNPIEWILKNHPGTKITSPYGMRKHPITGKMAMHTGTDLGGKSRGFIWRSPFPGVITYIGERAGRGLTVAMLIEDTSILQITQHHDNTLCKVGDVIKPGDPLGTNGTTGNVTGPHLHYELRWDNGTPLGSPVWGDPAEFILGEEGGEPRMKYTVKRGDTLAGIAGRFGISPWQQLIEWNKANYPSLEENPGLIKPGWVLNVQEPKTPSPTPTPVVDPAEFEALVNRVQVLETLLEAIRVTLRVNK